MKKIFLVFVTGIFFICCHDRQQNTVTDKRIVLRTDSINAVKLTDTLVIYESTCRGCEYEGSVRFSILDSLEIVKLEKVVTRDDNPPDVAGGSVGKEVIIIPVKPGITTIRLYKLLSDKTAREDSARFNTYTIEVKN